MQIMSMTDLRDQHRAVSLQQLTVRPYNAVSLRITFYSD